MIQVDAFQYKNQEKRIKVYHPFTEGVIEKLRTIKGFSYTKTYRCWYIPYTKEAFFSLKKLFCDVQVAKKPTYVVTPTIRTGENNFGSPKLETASISVDKEAKKLFVKHPYSRELYVSLKEISGAYRQYDKQQWVFKGTNENYLLIKKTIQNFGYKVEVVFNEPDYEKDTDEIIRAYVDFMKIKRYSKNTIEAYYPFFKTFRNSFTADEIPQLGYKELRTYFEQTVESQSLSKSQKNQLINAVKLYYEKILGHRRMLFNLHTRVAIKPVATILDFNVLEQYLKKVSSPHDCLMLFLVYFMGMTASSISKLTIDKTDALINSRLLKNNIPAKEYFVKLLQQHKEEIVDIEQKHLFEKNQQALKSKTIRQIVWEATGRYVMIEVYRKQYLNGLHQTDYSGQTKKVYVSTFLSFLKAFNWKHPALIEPEKIRDFLLTVGGKSEYTQNMYVNTISFYYTYRLKIKLQPSILIRPRRQFNLVDILTAEEVNKLIVHTSNVKHKCIIAITYSTGIRISEVLSIKLSDIDYFRQLIHIRKGKGKKDRFVPLDNYMLEKIRVYLNSYKPSEYLFEGAVGGSYSTSSFRKILKRAAKAANIEKRVFPHLLRHSRATHLIEQGTDISIIQKLLGHQNIDTTTKYTHIANTTISKLRNPLEDFKNHSP